MHLLNHINYFCTAIAKHLTEQCEGGSVYFGSQFHRVSAHHSRKVIGRGSQAMVVRACWEVIHSMVDHKAGEQDRKWLGRAYPQRPLSPNPSRLASPPKGFASITISQNDNSS